MGLADVLGVPVIRWWSALVAVFGFGVAFAFTGRSRPSEPTLGLLLVAACVVLWFTESKIAAGAVTAVAGLIYLEVVPSTMTVCIIWGSLALALFDGEDLRLVLRVQAAVIYLFAAVNKLWPAFLSGDMLEAEVEWLPYAQAVSVATIAVELGLAVAVLARWRYTPHAVVALHVPIAICTAISPLHFLTLVAYGGMMFWLVTGSLVNEDRDPAVDPLGVVGLVDVGHHRPDLDVARDRAGRTAGQCDGVVPAGVGDWERETRRSHAKV